MSGYLDSSNASAATGNASAMASKTAPIALRSNILSSLKVSFWGTPDSRPPLQSEHEQHRLVAHLAKLRRVDEPGPGVAAEPRQDGDVLLAAGLEGHRRRVDAGADIDLPHLLKAYVVIGAE